MFVATMTRRRADDRSAAILCVGIERAVERQKLDTGRQAPFQLVHRPVDFGRTGKKAQHVASRRLHDVARRRRRRTPRAGTRSRADATGPGTSTIGQSSRNADTGAESSVADITTIRRSSRARQA